MSFNPDLLDNVIPPPGTQYKSSEKFHKGLSALGLLVGTVIGIGIGWLYGIISFYNPIIYLGFLALIGAVLGVSFAGMLSKRIGKSRNLIVDMVTALFIGFFTWYGSWCYFYADQMSMSYGEALLRFGEVIEYAINYASYHVMSIGRFSSSGMPMPSEVMFLFYVIEFIALLVPVWLARKHHLTSYFCEGCNKANKVVTVYGKRTQPYENAFNALRQGDASCFAEAELVPKFETLRDSVGSEKVIGAYRLEFSNCTRCKNNPIIDVYNGIVQANDKGELEFAGESPW